MHFEGNSSEPDFNQARMISSHICDAYRAAAAVMISRELAKEVDFFSIGTNDLTQYTLAIDRQNPKLDDFYDAHHPAVLKMIHMVAQNAHAEGIWAGICGELGADLELTEHFLQMGIDELSVSPGRILPIRKIVRESECGCE